MTLLNDPSFDLRDSAPTEGHVAGCVAAREVRDRTTPAANDCRPTRHEFAQLLRDDCLRRFSCVYRQQERLRPASSETLAYPQVSRNRDYSPVGELPAGASVRNAPSLRQSTAPSRVDSVLACAPTAARPSSATADRQPGFSVGSTGVTSEPPPGALSPVTKPPTNRRRQSTQPGRQQRPALMLELRFKRLGRWRRGVACGSRCTALTAWAGLRQADYRDPTGVYPWPGSRPGCAAIATPGDPNRARRRCHQGRRGTVLR